MTRAATRVVMERPSLFRQSVLIFAVTFVGIFLLLRSNLVSYFAYAVEKGRLQAVRETLPSAEELAHVSLPARQVAQLVTPSVVYIETEVVLASRSDDSKPASGDEGPGNEEGDARDGLEESRRRGDLPEWHPLVRRTGIGSGFVFDADRGHILTNYHVIERADVIRVRLADGRGYVAEVVGIDPETDLAVIAVDAEQLHEVPLGDSETVQVGDDVFALGNPFQLAGSVSRGIISAKGRSNVNIHGIVYRGFLQTDAVINPGNSGGPLVNMRGEVVGVNTAIATQTGHYDGVGFAIPMSRVRQLLPKLVAGQRVARGYLGVSLQPVNESRELVNRLGWKHRYGTIIGLVEAETAAESAGLLRHDIIAEVNGERIDDQQHLIEVIGVLVPGSRVTLKIWRDQEFSMIEATLGRRPTSG